jgi:hypothetical protein
MKQSEQFQLFGETEEDDIPDKKVQMAWQLFVSVEYQVQVADRKVQAVFGMNAFLVAAISLQNQQPLQHLLQNGLNVSAVLDLLLKAGFLACVTLATWSAIKALTPRFKLNAEIPASKTSLFYFGDIQMKSIEDFVSTFATLPNKDAVKQILSQVQIISKILSRKYQLLHRSTMFLSVALVIWILLSLNKFLG